MAISTINQAGLTAPLTLTAPVINTVTSAASTALTLQSAGTTAVTIDTSQNVGIGTASPASKLDVKAGSGSVISRSTGGYNFKAYYDVGRTTYTAIGYDGLYTVGAQDLYIISGQSSIFRINSNSSPTEAMRIDTSGNFLVNTTSAYSASGNTGKTNISFAGASQSGMIILENDNQSNGHFVDFVNSAQTTCGSIIRNTTSNAVLYNTSSDYRLKDNIQPITNGLEKLAQLKPSTWTWKEGGNDGEGFIAHEVAQIIPNAVSGEKDALDKEGNPIYQGMDASYLVATLTAAIQELNAKVDAQAAEIQALKAGK